MYMVKKKYVKMINLLKPYLDKDTFDEIRTKKRHQDHDSLLMLTVTGSERGRGVGQRGVLRRLPNTGPVCNRNLVPPLHCFI